jgi:hypothetical protein
MKQMVARIGPLLPAFATVGASVCTSSLLLTTGPQALGPPPVVPPLTTKVGRVVASFSPPAQPLSRSRGPAARPADRRSLSAPAPRSATSTPTSRGSSRPPSPVGAAKAPPPSAPSPASPAPPVTRPPASVPIPKVSTDKEKRPKEGAKPGWGHGDPNHDHAGPRGKGAKGQENQATTTPAPPPVPEGDQHGPSQNGGKKSTPR